MIAKRRMRARRGEYIWPIMVVVEGATSQGYAGLRRGCG